MSSSAQQNTPHTCKLNVVGHLPSFGKFRNELEYSPKFLTEQARCLGAVAPPPTRFVADLLRSERGGKYSKSH